MVQKKLGPKVRILIQTNLALKIFVRKKKISGSKKPSKKYLGLKKFCPKKLPTKGKVLIQAGYGFCLSFFIFGLIELIF